MPEIPAPIQKIIDETPETKVAGTVAHSVAVQAYHLAYARGMDMDSEECAQFIRDQLDATPGTSSGGHKEISVPSDRTGAGNGGGKTVKLSDAQREIAKLTGLTDAEYAQNVQLLADHKQQGYFG